MMGEGTTPSEWLGERIVALTEAGENVQGILEGVTEQGVVVNTTGRRERGPTYYSWRTISWMYPADRQRID